MAEPGARPPLIARLVGLCARHAWIVAPAGLLLGVAALIYVTQHFAMSTNTDDLLSPKLPWRQREIAFAKAFPQEQNQIVVVIDGATPELAEAAAAQLSARLATRTDQVTAVVRPDGGPFWAQEGLLFASVADVKSTTAQLIAAQPFLGPLAADPSLRGLMGALSTALQGVTTGQAELAQLDRPIARLADAVEGVQAGKPTFFSWRTLITGQAADPRELRKIVLVSPKLDYGQLEPGAAATDAIRATAAGLKLDAAHGVRVRLTGDVPLADEEFGSLADRAGLIASLAATAIILMLWLATRSARLIGAILITTLIGLVSAAAWGLLVFHTFNVISIAFIPLFVGLGIDFGIQLSVRFRTENRPGETRQAALVEAGRRMGGPLTLAATAIACGFLAFAPTDYYGVSQLGVIAGAGMFIALALNLTVLPALIRLFGPGPTPTVADPPQVVRLDGFLLRHRWAVVGGAVVAALISAALIPFLRFDFNPIHLRSAKTESVSTILDLMADPDLTPNTAEVIRPSLAAADALAARVAKLPQVKEARTLSDFVPPDQPAKLAIISDASLLLDLSLNPVAADPPPTDAETVQGLAKTAADLDAAAGTATDPAALDARRLAADLRRLAAGPPAGRAALAGVLIPPLQTLLDQTRGVLAAQPVTLASLPADVSSDWITADGRARVSIAPSGDSNDNAVLTRFIAALTPIAPDVTGAPVGIQRSGQTIVGAFIEAGALSFVAITLLLFAVLRRVRDVAITMAPIVLTGLLTMGTCVAIGQPLNFANIIALPLLFGIGVAFHIYFVMSWRSGGSHLLTSSLAKAVFFSALTTATGFGSLWMSSHPGTASMGLLLMISLVWTLVSALLFQPALMGPPPKAIAGAAPS